MKYMDSTNINDLDQLGHSVVNHIEQNLTNGVHLCGLKWTIRYLDSVSNSHSAPLSGVTNWENDRNQPTGYEGFEGRVWCCLSDDPDGFGSDAFRGTMTHTGTGGYGNYGTEWKNDSATLCPLSYQYTIFLDDFPSLRENLMKQYDSENIIRALKGIPKKEVNILHTFGWEK